MEYKPFLVQSRDGGNTWEEKNNNLPDISSSDLKTTSCTKTGSICIVAGPYLAQTIDGGKNWEIVKGLPKNVTFRSTSCTGIGTDAICTAVGDGILSQTRNGGKNWSVASIEDLTEISTFSSTSCIGNGHTATCIAVGGSGKFPCRPLIVQTVDGGFSWRTVHAKGSLPDKGKFNASICKKNKVSVSCIAAGYALNWNYLFFANSQDDNKNWYGELLNK